MVNRLISMSFAGALAFSGLAYAEVGPANDPRAIPVSIEGLDLSETDSAAILLSRLRRAAHAACQPAEITRAGGALRRAIELCEQQAVDTAVARLNQPELSRLHSMPR